MSASAYGSNPPCRPASVPFTSTRQVAVEATWSVPSSASTTVSMSGPVIHSGLRAASGSAVRDTCARSVRRSSSGVSRSSSRCSPGASGVGQTARYPESSRGSSTPSTQTSFAAAAPTTSQASGVPGTVTRVRNHAARPAGTGPKSRNSSGTCPFGPSVSRWIGSLRRPREVDQTAGCQPPSPVRCRPCGPNVTCTGSPSGVSTLPPLDRGGRAEVAPGVVERRHELHVPLVAEVDLPPVRLARCPAPASETHDSGTVPGAGNRSRAAGPSSKGTVTSTTSSATVYGRGRGSPPNGLASSGAPVTPRTRTRISRR